MSQAGIFGLSNDTPTLYMMVGLPGSGKSTKAKEIELDIDVVILSSDDIRAELFGDVNNQENNGIVFEEINRRARTILKNGRSVVIDATNINSKKRMNTLKQFGKYRKVCLYMTTHKDQCMVWNAFRGASRERSVPPGVIDRMHHSLQVPMYFEGWDEIYVIGEDKHRAYHMNSLTPLLKLSNTVRYETFEGYLIDSMVVDDIVGLAQDNPHHTFSVSRHTYHVYKQVIDLCNSGEIPLEDSALWIMTAIFHDAGKAETKAFRDGSKYASFYGHENVSAQIAVHYLHFDGFSTDFILEVAQFVQLHMKLLNIKDEAGLNNFKSLIGDEWFKRLQMFRKIDENAR